MLHILKKFEYKVIDLNNSQKVTKSETERQINQITVTVTLAKLSKVKHTIFAYKDLEAALAEHRVRSPNFVL